MKNTLLLLLLTCSVLCVKAQKIPMRVQDDGLFIQGTINSVKTDFMFDTGAGITVISGNLYNRLKASLTYKGPVTGFRHDGERLDGVAYTVPFITIGDFTARNVPVMVWAELDNSGVDAILSLQPFQDQPISLDFVNKQFVIENASGIASKAKYAEVIPLKFDHYRDLMLDVFVPIVLDGKILIDAELDTGTPAWNFVLNPVYLKQLNADSTKIKKQQYKQLPNGKPVYDQVYNIPTVAYQGSAVLLEKDKTTSFREGLIYGGLIGAGMFKQSVLTIDIANKRLLVSKPIGAVK